MQLDTTLATLHTAGISTTPISQTQWDVRVGFGPTAPVTTVSDEGLIDLVERYQQSFVPTTQPILTLAQTVAMLRATGMTVEPMDACYWQVVFCSDDARTYARMIPQTKVLSLGAQVAQLVPVVLGNLPPHGTRRAQPLDGRTLMQTLAHLGYANTKQVAQLHHGSEADVGQVLAPLVQAGHVRAGACGNWLLSETGWQQAAQFVALERIWGHRQPALADHLAFALAHLTHELHSIQCSQLEIVYGRTAYRNAALLTVAPQSGSIVWTHDLDVQAAAAGLPTLTVLVKILEADEATSTELPALLARLRQDAHPTQCFPCIIASDDGLADVAAAALGRHLPHGPWAVSSLAQLTTGQWVTHGSGQLLVDLALALRAGRDG